MSFHFPLQAVFHFRQSVEHQQELRLRAANQQVIRARHLILQIDNRTKDVHSLQLQELSAGTTAAEVRFTLQCEAVLGQQRRAMERELLRLQNARDQQKRAFEQARRDRETFESLYDHQLREYKREAARREQRQLDDLFLLRRAYLTRG